MSGKVVCGERKWGHGVVKQVDSMGEGLQRTLGTWDAVYQRLVIMSRWLERCKGKLETAFLGAQGQSKYGRPTVLESPSKFKLPSVQEKQQDRCSQRAAISNIFPQVDRTCVLARFYTAPNSLSDAKLRNRVPPRPAPIHAGRHRNSQFQNLPLYFSCITAQRSRCSRIPRIAHQVPCRAPLKLHQPPTPCVTEFRPLAATYPHAVPLRTKKPVRQLAQIRPRQHYKISLHTTQQRYHIIPIPRHPEPSSAPRALKQRVITPEQYRPPQPKPAMASPPNCPSPSLTPLSNLIHSAAYSQRCETNAPQRCPQFPPQPAPPPARQSATGRLHSACLLYTSCHKHRGAWCANVLRRCHVRALSGFKFTLGRPLCPLLALDTNMTLMSSNAPCELLRSRVLDVPFVASALRCNVAYIHMRRLHHINFHALFFL